MSTAKVAGVEVDTRHWIGGRRIGSERTFTDVSPVDESPIAEIARGTEVEVDAAVSAPREAFRTWAATPPDQRAYDWRGDPELAHATAALADKHGTWITAIDDPYLPLHYGTVNLWSYLGRGLGKRWVSVSNTAETGDTEDFLRAGRAIGEAIAQSDRRVLLLASGAMSHTFWPLRELRAHEASDPAHIRTEQARAADADRIAWLEAGDHARVIDTRPDFLGVRPEAKFAHYLMMVAALGGRSACAPGRAFSKYENSVGTGQMHIWFDRPAAGWRTDG